MGSNWSTMEREPSPDPWWPDAQLHARTHTTDQEVKRENVVENTEAVTEQKSSRGKVRQDELDAFKQELARKRALRHEALAALQAELRDLRSRVGQMETSEHELRQELERERDEKNKLVTEKEKLLEEVEQKAALEKQIQALKDVSEIGKEMLRIRELQVKELKKKLVEINISSVTAPPEDLRIEYEKQIENIRKLRTLYEERAAATLLEHRRELEREEAKINVLEAKLSELQKETDECKEDKKDLEEKVEKLENAIQTKEDELEIMKDKLSSSTAQNRNLNSQMKLINHLFSKMLISPKVDLDRLVRLLKENHGLITDLTEKGDSNEVAALLVDLATQVEKEREAEKKSEQNSSTDSSVKSLQDTEKHEIPGVNSESEIAANLSKVWRVMIELLSHHQGSGHTELSGGAESCYKCIQTPSGPRSVISVSQTFLTLKDLILEKNRLVKEVSRLKTLNNHLEHRLGSQEKRLLVVTSELRKTWGVVNKLRAQHKQLHTHEKILRYELQQKRCMLNELKEELDHCRDKWEQARQKNSQTEEDWKKLRKEFAARKSRKESNSAESGYEEEDIAHSPPSEPIINGDLFEMRQNEGSETELSEEDIEHSDGNSFDTVIDLLDIACLDNQNESESETPFALREVPPDTTEISTGIIPLSGSEFTDGLDQIESEDLAAVLDIQYQNPLLGADYNLSLPSSSGSSPIPTENDDNTSSGMDISEEESSTKINHVYTTPLPVTKDTVSEDKFFFGSNSSQNISKFLEGLIVEPENTEQKLAPLENLQLNIPSTSQRDENDSTTPIINNHTCYQFPVNDAGSKLSTENISNNGDEKEIPKNKIDDTNQTGKEQFQDSETISQTTSSNITTSLTDVNGTFLNTSSGNPEEILRAREERLKRLEQQCRSLVSKVMSTSFRSEILSNKLDELHLSYGSSEETSEVEDDSNQKFKLHESVDSDNSGNDIKKDVPVVPCESSNQEKMSNAHTEPVYLSLGEGESQELPLEKIKEPSLEARALRLKRLEDQCKSLFSKMAATSTRSELISNRLDELHEARALLDPIELNQPSTSRDDKSNETQTICDSSKTYQPKYNISENNPQIQVGKDLDQPDLVSESKEILNKCSHSGPSSEAPLFHCDSKKDRTPEQILEARAERFKRLEEQCKSLVSKMTATSLRSEIISNKLDELHSCYGSSENMTDSDEHSSSPKEQRRRLTPNSSPKHNRKTACAENEKQTSVCSDETKPVSSEENIVDRISFTQTSEPQLTNKVGSDNENIEKPTRTPEEILEARAQRLSRLEEQCKSLFSKMSATSQRSDIISSRLEELHEMHGHPSTSAEVEHHQGISSQVPEVTNSGTSLTHQTASSSDKRVSDVSENSQTEVKTHKIEESEK